MHMEPVKIKLKKNENVISSCSSRWWGNPWMPREIEYPHFKDSFGDYYPYNFICQIRLEEVMQVCPRKGLPRAGMLYFFAKLDHCLGRNVPEKEIMQPGIWAKDAIKVIYIRNVEEQELTEHEILPDDNIPFAPVPRQIQFAGKGEPDETVAEDIRIPGHRLLGIPGGMTSGDWAEPCRGWKLLLQVAPDEDTDFNLRFPEGGSLYFLIDPGDLKRRNFSKVRALVRCTSGHLFLP